MLLLLGCLASHAICETIAPGETQHHELAAEAGYVAIEVEANGTRLEVTAGGHRLFLNDGPVRGVRLCYVTAEPASAPVRVRSLERIETRTYRLRAVSRAVEGADAARAKGCALQREAMATVAASGRQQLLDEARKAFTEANDLRGVAEVLTPLGEALWEIGRRADAVAAHVQAVATWKQLGEPGREAAAMVTLGVGYLFTPGKADLGARTLRESAQIAARAGDTIAEAAALSNMVSFGSQTARAEDAGPMARRAIELCQKAAYRKGEADAWNMYGQSLQRTSLAEAADAYRRSLALRRGLEDEAGTAQCLNNLGTVFSQQGEPGKAIESLEESLAIRKRIAPPRSIANSQHNLGVEYLTAGEYERAIAIFEEALQTWAAIQDPVGAAASKSDLALVYLQRGARDRAERLYNEALTLHRSIKNQAGEANVLRSLAAIHRERGEYDKAVALLQQAVDLSRKGQFRLMQVRAMTALAGVYSQLGRYNEALQLLEEGRPIAAIARNEQALLLSTAAAMQLRLGRVQEGLGLYREAAAIGEELQRPGLLANIYGGTAEAYVAANDLGAAREASQRAMALLEDLRNAQASPEARAGLLSYRRTLFHNAATILLRSGDARGAFAAVERGRARSLMDLLARAPNPRPEFREERAMRNALSAKAGALARLQNDAGRHKEAAVLRTAIAKQQDDYKVLLERIARQHPELTRATQPATLAEIRRRLPANAALLAFSLGSSQSYLWRVTRTSLDAFALGPRAPIERAVAAFRGNLKAGGAGVSALLFADARLKLGSYGKLYVVPDGGLHMVPWAALPGLQGAQLVVLPSATALARLPGANRVSGRPIAIFADPVYQPSDTPFEQLRFSAMEAAAIERLGGKTTVRRYGVAASRQALTGVPLDPFGILHFATHAVADAIQPELSAIVLSLQDGQAKPVDGFLRTYDIERLRLRKPLVVLSACDTAVGPQLEGEGPLTISRAFLAAGAGSVIATLWAVDDAASAQLMKVFYEGLLQRGLDAAAALQRAQEVVRSEPRWADPYYWAGFLYTGV
ncbi:MAG: CHAT domain-containing protein [Bryobacterales bacterium]|nr:CHAT domain-containing protein [Bryobacterales bacterium]